MPTIIYKRREKERGGERARERGGERAREREREGEREKVRGGKKAECQGEKVRERLDGRNTVSVKVCGIYVFCILRTLSIHTRFGSRYSCSSCLGCSGGL